MDFQERQNIENLIIPEDYFEEEVREGFYISTMMKRYWACQLQVLSEIAKICKKHDIRWYADCGSLIGAVRHGGYIPWDDDLDICMLRHDYNRFFEVAKKELPREYFLLNVSQTPDYEVMLGRVVNSKVIDFGIEHLKEFHGCPYTVGVDIFPLDGLYADEDKEEKRIKRANEIAAKIAGTEPGKKRRELYLRNDKVYSECSSENAEYVALMPFWVQYRNHKYPAKAYENIIYMPFENTLIPVPAGYEQVLEIEYGDFMPVYKKGGIHDYPVYRDQERILAENIGHNPYRYTYSEADLSEASSKKPFAEMCHERIDMLKGVPTQIAALVQAGDADNAAALLGGCQNIAITIGDLIEGKYEGDEHLAPAVKSLEDYCEVVYQASTAWSEEAVMALVSAAEEVEGAIEKLLLEGRKEVLFIPVKANWWNSMAPVYEHFLMPSKEGGKIDVHVMPISYFRKYTDGSVGELFNDKELFPEGIVTDSYGEYDVAKRHPDYIVTQFPYDGWNSALGIEQSFFTKSLFDKTDKLIYVPMLETEDPVAADDKLTAALEDFVEQPACVYADEIVIYSELMKRTYIDLLTKKAGSESKKLWKEKITVFAKEDAGKAEKGALTQTDENWLQLIKDAGDRKIMLYQVTGGFLLRYGERALEKIRRSLEIFEENKDKVFVVFCPSDETAQLKLISPEIADGLKNLAMEFASRGVCVYDDKSISMDNLEMLRGYFGDRGYTARRCVLSGIPVMIESIDV
jgi:phosphorylcholine metabolism protein LicD